jgi:hypothetical protein
MARSWGFGFRDGCAERIPRTQQSFECSGYAVRLCFKTLRESLSAKRDLHAGRIEINQISTDMNIVSADVTTLKNLDNFIQETKAMVPRGFQERGVLRLKHFQAERT